MDLKIPRDSDGKILPYQETRDKRKAMLRAMPRHVRERISKRRRDAIARFEKNSNNSPFYSHDINPFRESASYSGKIGCKDGGACDYKFKDIDFLICNDCGMMVRNEVVHLGLYVRAMDNYTNVSNEINDSEE